MYAMPYHVCDLLLSQGACIDAKAFKKCFSVLAASGRVFQKRGGVRVGFAAPPPGLWPSGAVGVVFRVGSVEGGRALFTPLENIELLFKVRKFTGSRDFVGKMGFFCLSPRAFRNDENFGTLVLCNVESFNV